MRTLITVRPTTPDPDTLRAMNHRTLRAGVEFNYHLLRHLDAQIDLELRNIIAARRIGTLRLRQAERLRTEAQAALHTYLQEICRRVRATKNLRDDQHDDELLAAYLREAAATTEHLRDRAQSIETAPKRVQKNFTHQ